MVCFQPLHGHYKPGGGIAFDGSGYRDRPVSVQCGQCIGCRVKRSREWALRCVHEAKCHKDNSFITLTYNNTHIPRTGSLYYRDVQLFLKRTREAIGKFRYFLCGEYGDTNLRPHYHACIFGLDFSGDRIPIRVGRNPLYYSAQLEELWGKGYCTVGDLTYSSAAYVARYVMKKVTGDLAEDHYTRYDSKTGESWVVEPEFVRMSLKPGVGSQWFEKFKSDVFPVDEVVYDGKRFKPPRYYDRKLEEEVLKVIKDRRVAGMLNNSEDLTPARLKAREEFERRKMDHFQKRGLE